MKFRLIILSLFAVAAFSFKGATQTVARVNGLEKDSAYMNLLTKEKQYSALQDSINNALKEKRAIISSADAQTKETLSTEIMTLENRMFDIRGTLGELSAKTASIEKKFLLENMNSTSVAQQGSTSVKEEAFLVNNNYFKLALDQTEYKTIVNSAKTESVINDLASNISVLYGKYKSSNAQFRQAGSKTEADSLVNVIDSIKTEIIDLDSELGDTWNNLYQTKIDAYNVLLDKMSLYDKIESFGNKSRNERSAISEIQAQVVAPNLAGYLRGKLLLNEYELALAKAKNLTLAKDSISKTMANVDIEKYDFKQVKTPNWTFIDYEPLKVERTTIYNEENPIGELVIPTVGEVFKVKLGTYTKKQTSYYIFRKVAPIQYREEAEGKYSYFAGSYKTYDEAKKGYDLLRRYGMKVTIAHWKDGNELDKDGNIIELTPVGDAYNIVIKELNDNIRSIIKEQAPEMEIMSNPDGYSVGLFDTYEQAKAIADMIGANAKVVGVSFN